MPRHTKFIIRIHLNYYYEKARSTNANEIVFYSYSFFANKLAVLFQQIVKELKMNMILSDCLSLMSHSIYFCFQDHISLNGICVRITNLNIRISTFRKILV